MPMRRRKRSEFVSSRRIISAKEWEKHLRIERWLMNKSLKKEWREVLREYAEKEARDYRAVAKALGAPLDFGSGELPYGGIADDDEVGESLP